MNLKESKGQHEFMSLPRVPFKLSGDLLPCIDKSKMMDVLDDLPNKISVDLQDVTNVHLTPRTATVIDGMAIVQTMGKLT